MATVGIEKGKEEFITKLDAAHELFVREYPRLAKVYGFYQNLFSEIDKRCKNVKVEIVPFIFLVDIAQTVETPAFPERQKIMIIRKYADQMEKKGYFVSWGGVYSADELFYHEFLHALYHLKPELFDYSPGIIEMYPELSRDNPPKTSKEILERINEMKKRRRAAEREKDVWF